MNINKNEYKYYFSIRKENNLTYKNKQVILQTNIFLAYPNQFNENRIHVASEHENSKTDWLTPYGVNKESDFWKNTGSSEKENINKWE